MRIAICDDIKDCNKHLNKLLKNYIKFNGIEDYEIKEYTSGQILLNEYTRDLFDFIFLDVQMDDLSGFDTAKQIRELHLDMDVDIIFVTNMKDDVQRGYDYNAKGYIYKVVTQEQIDTMMDKLIKERLIANKGGLYKIKVKNEGTIYLPLSKIMYFESQGHDITAQTEAEAHVFLGTISNLTKELEDKGFVQISQSCIVNIAYVFKEFENELVIKKGKDLTVSKPYKRALREAIKKRETTKWKL